jgi:catechol 2,3-dioxygenase-like lactoylglutathione lyase family enzyme
MRLDHITLLVTSFGATARFWRDVLGFDVEWGDVGNLYTSLRLEPRGVLSLFKRDLISQALGAPPLPPDAPGQDRVVIALSTTDVDAETEQLKESGVTVVREPRDLPHWGVRAAHLRDPDGFLLQLCSPLARRG